jgi:hypothetical protein
MRTDGVDPIIECSSEGPKHLDIKVVVTSAGWDYHRGTHKWSYVNQGRRTDGGWQSGKRLHGLSASGATTSA